MANIKSKIPATRWIFDSSATAHICKIRSAFKTFRSKTAIVRRINKDSPQLIIEEQEDIDLLVAVNR